MFFFYFFLVNSPSFFPWRFVRFCRIVRGLCHWCDAWWVGVFCLPKPCLVTLQKVDVLKNCSQNHVWTGRTTRGWHEFVKPLRSHKATLQQGVFTQSCRGGVVAFGSTSLHERSLVSGKYDFWGILWDSMISETPTLKNLQRFDYLKHPLWYQSFAHLWTLHTKTGQQNWVRFLVEKLCETTWPKIHWNVKSLQLSNP